MVSYLRTSEKERVPCNATSNAVVDTGNPISLTDGVKSDVRVVLEIVITSIIDRTDYKLYIDSTPANTILGL